MKNTPLISRKLAQQLIAEQFPEFAHLPIKSVDIQGHDNLTFRLGDKMLMRMPSAEAYALKVSKEQEWLPKIGAYVSLPIPEPIALGQPSGEYPWNWSIYRWREGESANTVTLEDDELYEISMGLAQFLKELHAIQERGKDLKPGLHNWWRGDHVSVYDSQARDQISELKEVIDSDAALSLWERAIRSRWRRDPVWIHGDLSSGNILIKEGKVSAVIDFGGMGIGDPACDLAIAWTFLKGRSREIFRNHVGLDHDTWARARGWALWKATFELVSLSEKKDVEAEKQHQIIDDVLNEGLCRESFL